MPYAHGGLCPMPTEAYAQSYLIFRSKGYISMPYSPVIKSSPLLALGPSNIIDNLGCCCSLTRPTLKINGWKKPKSPLQDTPRLLQPQRCCELICSRRS